MNWDAIGAIGVIATLGYLAIQVRQNSSVVRSAPRQAISTLQAEVVLQMAQSPEMRAAIARWRDGTVPSDPDEAMHDDLLRRSLLRMYENQFHQHRDGTFEAARWPGYLENMTRTFSWPTFREWWSESESLCGRDFARFANDRLRAMEQGR